MSAKMNKDPNASSGPQTRLRRRQLQETAVIADAFTQVQVKSRVLEALLHLYSDFSDGQRIMDELVRISMDAIPCEAASLLLVDAEGEFLTFKAARGPVADKIKGMKLGAGRGIAGSCAVDRRTIAVSDVKSDARYAEEVSRKLGFETRSLLAVPILCKGDILGVIEIVNKRDGDIFARHEIELMERVARASGNILKLCGAAT